MKKSKADKKIEMLEERIRQVEKDTYLIVADKRTVIRVFQYVIFFAILFSGIFCVWWSIASTENPDCDHSTVIDYNETHKMIECNEGKTCAEGYHNVLIENEDYKGLIFVLGFFELIICLIWLE